MGGSAGYKAELTVGTGPGSVVGKARDVDLNIQGNAVDTSTRDGAGWKDHIQGLKEWDMSCGHLWVPDDAAFELMQTALMNGTEIHVKLLDITGATGHGYEGDAIVTGLKRGEPLDGALTADITLKGAGALTVIDPA